MKKSLLFGFMAIIALCAVIGCTSEAPEGKIPSNKEPPVGPDQVRIDFDAEYEGLENPAPVIVYKDEELGDYLPNMENQIDGNGNTVHFLGWHDEDGRQIGPTTTFWGLFPDDQDTDEIKQWTLYAKWEGRVTVVFHLGYDNAPAPPAPVTLEVGTALEARLPTVTRTGHAFLGWFNGTDKIEANTPITKDIAVTAEWEASNTITFNLNGAPGTAPAPINVGLQSTLTLPAAPTWELHRFDGWFPNANGTGTEIVTGAALPTSLTVWAKWTYVGGTPTVVGDTLVHESPLVAAGTSFAGTISATDGSISNWTAGAFQYLFPTTGEGYNISDYVRFVIQIDGVTTTGDNNASNVAFRQYGNSTQYGGDGSKAAWMSNIGSNGFPLQIRGAGSTGGFSVVHSQGNATMEVRIVSITFYKEPLYTVTFDLNGGTGTVPAPVQVYNGFSMGTDFPSTTPTKEDFTFVAWKNENGDVVTSTTLITGSWAIKADWFDPLLDPRRMELITCNLTSAPVYAFNLPSGDTFSDYDRVTFKLKMSPTSEYPGGRLRAWGTYALTGFNNNNRPGMGNTAANTTPLSDNNKLLSAGGYTGYTTDWTTQTITFTTRNATAENAATGLVGVAIGLIANNSSPTNVGSRTFYIKDIVLSNSAGTKTVNALLPTDPLWSGNGETAYVTQNGPDVVTRQLLPYEEG